MSSSRVKIIEDNPTEIVEVRGKRGQRVVVAKTVHAGERTFHRWEFREDWGWVAQRTEFFVRGASGFVVSVRCVLHDVHKTKLGVFPKRLEYWSWDEPHATPRKPWEYSEVKFDRPGFMVGLEELPHTLVLEERRVRDWSERESWMRDNVVSLVKPDNAKGRAISTWLALVVAIGAAVCAFIGRKLMALGGVVAAITLLVVANGWAAGLFATPRVDSVKWPGALRSDRLCGVDCAYIAAGDTPYKEIFRLIEPGKFGSTMGRVKAALECCGANVERVDPRVYASPHVPSILHDPEQNHFIVVLQASGDGSVQVCDPGNGVYSANWNVLRARVSPAALAVTRLKGE